MCVPVFRCVLVFLRTPKKLNQEIVSDGGCFFGILSLEKAFEPGFWSEITITDLLKAKMAAH